MSVTCLCRRYDSSLTGTNLANEAVTELLAAEHVLAAEPAMQENVHLNTEPSPLATDTAQQAQHATHDDAASLPASRQLEDAEEAMQASAASTFVTCHDFHNCIQQVASDILQLGSEQQSCGP